MRTRRLPSSSLMRTSMRESPSSPLNSTRTRSQRLSLTSAEYPSAAVTEPSVKAVPLQLTVMEPPAEVYVSVNGAGND